MKWCSLGSGRSFGRCKVAQTTAFQAGGSQCKPPCGYPNTFLNFVIGGKVLSGKPDAKAIGPRPELGRTARRAKPFGLAIYSPEGGVLSLPKGASLSQRGGSVDSYHQDTKTRSFLEGQSTLLFFVPWCLCGEESDCGYVALCPGPPNNTTSD